MDEQAVRTRGPKEYLPTGYVSPWSFSSHVSQQNFTPITGVSGHCADELFRFCTSTKLPINSQRSIIALALAIFVLSITTTMVVSAGIYKFQQQGIFIDCTIKVGDDRYEAHKNVLSMDSSYFYSLLKENKIETIDLTGLIDSKAFSDILRYMYTDEIDLNKANLVQMAEAADKLKIERLMRRCVDYVHGLVFKDLVKVLEASQKLDIYELVRTTGDICASKFWDHIEELKSVSHVVLIIIFERFELMSWRASDHDRYQDRPGVYYKDAKKKLKLLVFDWFRSAPEKTSEQLYDVVSRIKF